MPRMRAFYPSAAEFLARAQAGETAIPVCCELLADTLTPVAAFAALAHGEPHAFLLESVIGGEMWAAASFVGGRPHAVVSVDLGGVTVSWRDGREERHDASDPTVALKQLLGRFRGTAVAGLPRFFGGLVGYLSYDLVRAFERLPACAPDALGLPEGLLVLSDEIVVFDNFRRTVKPTVMALLAPGEQGAEQAYAQACARAEDLCRRLRQPVHLPELEPKATGQADVLPSSTFLRDDFYAAVRRARETIAAGDVVQVVLSQRFRLPRVGVDPFSLYRALRILNPSPYLYYLQFPEVVVAGASPEVMVRLDGEHVLVRPIAGTRRRGGSAEEDARLEAELRADPKERAEHVMLVDLGRNDVGRVCRPGTVRVTELMAVEHYSHVMHLVSEVEGELAAGRNAWDVLRATFPAGTLTGAPKIRAMEIIEELEPCRRGIYGGAVGYVSYSGHMDLAIAIRTLVVAEDAILAQAGAGVVFDSSPEREYEETVEKARALFDAVAIARSSS